MPRAERPPQLAWQVFRGQDSLRAGLLSPAALRSRAWTRLRYDVYADSRLERDHRLACHAVALRLPPGAVLAGRSAAFLHGVDHAATFTDDVHVIVPGTVRLGPQKGVRVHRTELDPADLDSVAGLPLTGPARTAWDLAVWHDLIVAVPIIDVLLRNTVLDRSDLDTLIQRRQGSRGNRMARQAFALADGRAQSPPESVLRVRLCLSDVPNPVPQYPVTLESGLVLHPDLAWPEYRVALEYDGQWHATAEQLHQDRRRLNQLAAAGWLVLHVTSERMRRDFAGLLREIREALTSRGWQR